MHVPINIPSLSMTTNQDVDMNSELIAHGYANIAAGFCGGLQNYLCYSNSLLYFKCNGGGKVSGYLLAAITLIFFCIGPSAVYYLPRVMPGCLLIHIGLDLSKEGLWDSYRSFDAVEYASIVAITVVMTFYGMTAGLGLGILCAALTFTIQASQHVNPIRGKMTARTLRSSQWRSQIERKLLDTKMTHVLVIQLQGQLFFGNATILASDVDRYLRESSKTENCTKFLVLDFTLVIGIDSSAAETICKIFEIGRKHNVRVCYSRGSKHGFPCVVPLSERLNSMNPPKSINLSSCGSCGGNICAITCKCRDCGEKTKDYLKKYLFESDNLDEGLCWCEDIIITGEIKKGSAANVTRSLYGRPISFSSKQVSQLNQLPPFLHQLYSLTNEESTSTIQTLLSFFEEKHLTKGTILWVQGSISDRAVLLKEGKLLSMLEDEAGTTEEILPGHLVGEFGLLTNQNRSGTLMVDTESIALVLSRDSYEKMVVNDPHTALVLSKICMVSGCIFISNF